MNYDLIQRLNLHINAIRINSISGPAKQSLERFAKKLEIQQNDLDKNGSKISLPLPEKYIFQNGPLIFRLLKDSFNLIYDFSGMSSQMKITSVIFENQVNSIHFLGISPQ